MVFPRNSLAAFLRHTKNQIQQCTDGRSKLQRMIFVIGNESADLDSLTSSIFYAYIKSIRPRPGAFASIYIPVVDIPRADLRLRPEFDVACRYANITLDHLLTQDEVPMDLLGSDQSRLVLVDHNRLGSHLSTIKPDHVIGIVDHHEDEGKLSCLPPEPRIIRSAGSCTSLVVEYCSTDWNVITALSLSTGAANGQGDDAGGLDDAAYTTIWDAQIAQFAISSILVDTANLTNSKTSAVDRKMVSYLEGRIQMSAKHAEAWDRDRFYDEIIAAKSHLDDLTLPEILRKDYKQWKENGLSLGISSVMISLERICQRSSVDCINKTLQEFMHRRNLDLFAIMTAVPQKSQNEHLKRQLLLQSRASGQRAAQAFVGHATEPLCLTNDIDLPIVRSDQAASDFDWRCFWRQGDFTKSRKQVAPLLREAMKMI